MPYCTTVGLEDPGITPTGLNQSYLPARPFTRLAQKTEPLKKKWSGVLLWEHTRLLLLFDRTSLLGFEALCFPASTHDFTIFRNEDDPAEGLMAKGQNPRWKVSNR